MCTLSIHTRVYARHPLIIAANRDEHDHRPWREPGHHWPDAPGVFGPLDVASGGSWLAVNPRGIVCALLNQGRQASLGTEMHSRGELVVAALRVTSIEQAGAWLSGLDVSRYLGFHLLLADAQQARLFSTRDGRLLARDLHPGAHVLSSRGLDAADCPKASRFLGHLRGSIPTEPEAHCWRYFRELLATRAMAQPKDGFWVRLEGGYGTQSSAIIALEAGAPAIHYLHARTAESPDRAVFDVGAHALHPGQLVGAHGPAVERCHGLVELASVSRTAQHHVHRRV
jgi:uncharacterized protein with NRDE domain